MKVMTFNLRFENDRDGENSWGRRRHAVVDVIRKYAPAVLGTQEGTPRQLEYLQDQLPQYRMYAPPRPWDETCQYPTLFYRTERLTALTGGEFWLSLTPQIHRSKDWDSAFPRMMSYALLREEDTSRTFWAVVTHLDHLGSLARLEQTGMLVEWLQERSEPRLLMGDFNDPARFTPARSADGPGDATRGQLVCSRKRRRRTKHDAPQFSRDSGKVPHGLDPHEH